MQQNFWPALLITAFAGLSTLVGGLIALFCKRENAKFLSVALGFSAGVMIYVSFTEILSKAQDLFLQDTNANNTEAHVALWFFVGVALIALLNFVLKKSSKLKMSCKQESCNHSKAYLLKMGLFTALAVGLHNLPEGLATFMSALVDYQIGVSIAIAIALHNIPEGIAVAAPIYYATGSRKKAIFYSFASGLAEPVGAVIGYFILLPFLTSAVLGAVFASVAGIMIFISIVELLPTAINYGGSRRAMWGLFAGMAVMAMSLILI